MKHTAPLWKVPANYPETSISDAPRVYRRRCSLQPGVQRGLPTEVLLNIADSPVPCLMSLVCSAAGMGSSVERPLTSKEKPPGAFPLAAALA